MLPTASTARAFCPCARDTRPGALRQGAAGAWTGHPRAQPVTRHPCLVQRVNEVLRRVPPKGRLFAFDIRVDYEGAAPMAPHVYAREPGLRVHQHRRPQGRTVRDLDRLSGKPSLNIGLKRTLAVHEARSQSTQHPYNCVCARTLAVAPTLNCPYAQPLDSSQRRIPARCLPYDALFGRLTPAEQMRDEGTVMG